MNSRVWQANNLIGSAHEGALIRIIEAAIRAVDPATAVHRWLKIQGDHLIVADQQYNLENYRRVRVVGAGKAGAPMAEAIAENLAGRLFDGLVIVKEGYTGGDAGKIKIVEAGHPIPDQRGVFASKKLAEILSDSNEDDLIICLISGGGSALLALPSPGISLSELQVMTATLLRCGANIQEINALRKHLEQLKGGQMVRLAAPATMIALILSDVVGDPLDVIASGPTSPDPTTYAQAWSILQRYQVIDQIPGPLISHLQKGIAGEFTDTPKAGEHLFQNVQNVIIGSNRLAALAGLVQARQEGFNTILLTTYLQGEAQQAGHFLASILCQVARTGEPLARPACIIVGGETTVTVRGGGLGGRNQELALAAVEDLAGLPDVLMATIATDGGDGPTDAAGAVVTGNTWRQAQAAGLEPHVYLQNNDSYHFFDQLGGLFRPGPTRTNVNDLVVMLAGLDLE